MRWGILANLALILVVSGVLLFGVFTASLKRAAIDQSIHESNVIADLVENQILRSNSPEKLWDFVRTVCQARSGLKLVVYDGRGEVLGGCGGNASRERVSLSEPGRSVQVSAGDWFAVLSQGFVVSVDLLDSFAHGIGAVRILLETPPSIFAPAWKFFAAYLALTQASLFLLGYILFHRTVIGPVKEVARLAARASGIADLETLPDSLSLQGDIQKISASLRGMIVKIVEDRDRMEELIERLSAINRELKNAQEGLIRSEKLASLGRLAAGVAHEIGNPLQILLGYVEILHRGADPESRAEVISRMDQELNRIHDILQQLVAFARPIQRNVVECDINALLLDCTAFVKHRRGFQTVEFEYVLDPNVPIVKTEPEKVRQALMNLFINSADAMPAAGGRIILRTRTNGDHVEISVEDNGCGIVEEHLEKVFDPFFTTKEPGKGTGLGLAVCLGLVESLGGTMKLSSRPDCGTTVVLTVPLEHRDVTEITGVSPLT
jgi:two-component system, NtrC family, sensor kinase